LLGAALSELCAYLKDNLPRKITRKLWGPVVASGVYAIFLEGITLLPRTAVALMEARSAYPAITLEGGVSRMGVDAKGVELVLNEVLLGISGDGESEGESESDEEFAVEGAAYGSVYLMNFVTSFYYSVDGAGGGEKGADLLRWVRTNCASYRRRAVVALGDNYDGGFEHKKGKRGAESIVESINRICDECQV